MDDDEIQAIILETILSLKPETVELLIEYLAEEKILPVGQIRRNLTLLENSGKLKFSPPQEPQFYSFSNFLKSVHALWFNVTIMILIISALAVSSLETESSLAIVRYLFGTAFILVLPGHSLIKALLPFKETVSLEGLTLSVGASLAVTPLTGLLLNFTPWGLTVATVFITLLIVILALSSVGLMRAYNAFKKDDSLVQAV